MSSWIVTLLVVTAVVTVIWPAGSALGWMVTAPCRDRSPWNWRVLAGPWAYFRWLDRN